MVGLLLSSCQDHAPVRIGFAGELTTRASGLGTNGRDGFLMAIEEINAQGGIAGRRVEGVIKDVRMHKETALHAIRQLKQEQVSAIVGPMTSQTAVNILHEVNLAEIPTVSPTASSNQLSGKDDYFFRVYYTNAQAAQLLAKRLVTQAKSQHITAIYDLSNKAYTEDWVNYFESSLTQNNSTARVSRIPFDLRTETLFLDIARDAINTEPDGILILANAVDTALVCQQLQKLGSSLPRYATGWSYSDDLIQFGGKSVEGMIIIQSANLLEQAPATRNFVDGFQRRFHNPPNFPAFHAYDATRLVLDALQHSDTPREIKNFLTDGNSYRGIQTDLSLDRFGDLKNPSLFLAQISGGEFLPAE